MSKRRTNPLKKIDVPLEPSEAMTQQPPKRAASAKKKSNRKAVTFSLDEAMLTTLDRVWYQLREMNPARKSDVNKSAILEAIMTEMLGEFEEKGRDSRLAYYLLGEKY